ncbi:glycosyltransferase family protein [Neotamlana sargassicola]|nr:hypothetical protein [Tamlana sargassicola]
MKMVFICGALEPGKDGVGDYTRRLSAALIKQGISVSILAYNDKFIKKKIEELQSSDGSEIPCLRLPHTWTSKQRTQQAKNWVDKYNPDWLSLQFVIYSFHNKGLPFGISSQLKQIVSDRKCQIMFHETWLGLKTNDSLKYQIIGFLQKRIIKRLRSAIKFKVVHTHTQFYMRELNKIGFYNVKYLPVFSNIPVIDIKESPYKENKKVKFVLFGSIHPNVDFVEFFNELQDFYKHKMGFTLEVIFIGKSGRFLDPWINELKSRKIPFSTLGEQNPESISEVLQQVNYGITTNPSFVVEKSGTVAAMREHGLKVIIVAEKTEPKDTFKLKFNKSLFEYKSGNLKEFLEDGHKKNTDVLGINSVAQKFLNDIKAG